MNIRRGGIDTIAQDRIALGKFLFHQPGDGAVGPVSFHARPQSGDVFGFRIIHFKQTSHIKSKRDGIECRFLTGLAQLFNIALDQVHGVTIITLDAGLRQYGRNIIAVSRGEVLLNLLAPPVTVHIPPPADVHEHVEQKGVPAPELLDQLVIGSPFSESDFDRAFLLLLGPAPNDREQFPVGRPE